MSNDPLLRRLEALPPPPLPPGLWPQLDRRRKRRIAVRRSASVAAIGLLAIAPLMVLWPAGSVRTPAASVPMAASAPDSAVSAIDHALQNAYARGASDDEIAPLWHARQRVLANPSSTDPS